MLQGNPFETERLVEERRKIVQRGVERQRGYRLELSIVRSIVKKLARQVDVKRPGAPDQGSVFSFTLSDLQAED